MAAITGNWTAPNKGIQQWAIEWLHRGPKNGNSPRTRLASELKYVRDNHGAHEAIEYRNYLLWLGSYPVKIRKV
jgi:hypothetical protein